MKLIDVSDNPYYPLPPDYPSLTEEGKRQARVNACQQWYHPSLTPEAQGLAFAAALEFFDLWYLRDDHDASFWAGFYDCEPSPSPVFHYDFAKSVMLHKYNVACAPRGSAKSTLIRKMMMLQMVSQPTFRITYATSTNRLAKRTGAALLQQFEANERLHADWGPTYPDGQFKPKKGEAPFSSELCTLKNRSSLFVTSAESRQRGDRPRMYYLDDPEFDPAASTSMSAVRENMDILLFRIIMPMVARANCGVFWVGTLISRRHSLYQAVTTVEKGGKHVPKDERFAHWNRMPVKALYLNETGDRKSVWPEMWPISRGPDTPRGVLTLDEIKAQIGAANFRSEYMNDPGTGDAGFFHLLPQNTYWYEDEDELLETDPIRSKAKICFTRKGEPVKQRISEFLASAQHFMCVDSSYTSGASSDYKALTVQAVTPYNEQFVLDCWDAKTTETELVKRIIACADRWKVPVVGVETVKQSFGLYKHLCHLSATQMRGMGEHHIFGVKPLKPGQMDKTSKIAALQFRFGDPAEPDSGGLVKMPWQLRGSTPSWTRLFNQIEDFNPDACLVADTLIETRRGPVPIQDVVAGDEVFTRFGLKRVKWAGQTGERQVVTRCGITGTPDHLVFTTRGWVPLCGLRNHHEIYTWRPSNTTGKLTIGETTDTMCEPSEPACTDRFGRITMDQSPKGTRSITKTEMPATTTSPTSNVSQQTSTGGCTPPNEYEILEDSLATKNQTCTRSSVRVAKCSEVLKSQALVVRNIVAGLAGTSTILAHTVLTQPYGSVTRSTVKDAEKRIRKFVGKRTKTPQGTVPVYDLTVEDTPEFFANGILVHNSDGGLEHDDLLDTLAMAPLLIPGLKGLPSPEPDELTTFDEIADGKIMNSLTELPKALAYNIAEIPHRVVEACRQKGTNHRATDDDAI